MNNLPRDKQVTILKALTEGVSIRSIERMTGVHRDTIMRLGVRVGEACERLHDTIVRDLECTDIQCDEIWSFVSKKARSVLPTDDTTRVTDLWVWVAFASDSKLVASFRTGKRDGATAKAFVDDLHSRLRNRPQISTDGLSTYVDVIEQAFGAAVDYAQVVKSYEPEPIGPGRYSPPKVSAIEKTAIAGNPDMDRASTSYVERNNLNIRMTNRRFTRLTNAFSKKVENHRASVALNFAVYNLCRVHGSLRVTPAMAANVTDHVWTMDELLDAAEAA